MPAGDRWRSVDEIAERLGVSNDTLSKDTVYGWLTSKDMPGHRVGRFWKFKKDEIDEWVRAGGAAVKVAQDDRSARSGDESEER